MEVIIYALNLSNNPKFLVIQNSGRSTKFTVPVIQRNDVLKLLIWQSFIKPQALGM
jgi:hypothetical protein